MASPYSRATNKPLFGSLGGSLGRSPTPNAVYNPGASAYATGRTPLGFSGNQPIPGFGDHPGLRKPKPAPPARRPIRGGGGYAAVDGGGGMVAPPLGVPTGVSTGIPYGSINLKPSKFSGGFSRQMALNIQNNRTGTADQIWARQTAGPAGVAATARSRGGKMKGADGEVSSFGGRSGNYAAVDGGGGMTYGEGSLFDMADRAQQEAKAANENRYNQILADYSAREAAARSSLAGLGKAETQAIDDRYAQAAAGSAQDLAGRGLGNTTIRASVLKGYAGEASRQKTALAENLQREEQNLINPLIGDRLAFMERRNDVAGTTGMQLAELAAKAGDAGYDFSALRAPRRGRAAAGAMKAKSKRQTQTAAVQAAMAARRPAVTGRAWG